MKCYWDATEVATGLDLKGGLHWSTSMPKKAFSLMFWFVESFFSPSVWVTKPFLWGLGLFVTIFISVGENSITGGLVELLLIELPEIGKLGSQIVYTGLRTMLVSPPVFQRILQLWRSNQVCCANWHVLGAVVCWTLTAGCHRHTQWLGFRTVLQLNFFIFRWSKSISLRVKTPSELGWSKSQSLSIKSLCYSLPDPAFLADPARSQLIF